jgi:hypothetical protein
LESEIGGELGKRRREGLTEEVKREKKGEGQKTRSMIL